MPSYILLFTLTPEGRENLLGDAEVLHRITTEVETDDTKVLGLYAVLGECDFVGIVESPDNAGVARFSLELGVKAGAHIRTMPAIPVGRLHPTSRDEASRMESEVSMRGGARPP